MLTRSQPFIFSLAAPFIPQFFKDPLDQTAPYWDYVVGNETEAAAYAESHDLNTADIPTIAKALANLPKENKQRKRVAIITQGTDPTIVAVQGEDQVKTFPVHQIAKEEIVDTTGAGDAFAGGFVAGLVKGESIETCVDMGQWLAALSLRELGPAYVLSDNYTCKYPSDPLTFLPTDTPPRRSRTRLPSKKVHSINMIESQDRCFNNFDCRVMIPRHPPRWWDARKARFDV